MWFLFLKTTAGHDLSELVMWICNESCLACICIVDIRIDEFTGRYRDLASYMGGFHCLANKLMGGVQTIMILDLFPTISNEIDTCFTHALREPLSDTKIGKGQEGLFKLYSTT